MEPRSRPERDEGRQAHDDPLGLDPAAMREQGYRTVDALVDWLSDPSVPVLGPAVARHELEPGDRGPPAQGERFDVLLERLFSEVVPRMARNDHPRAFAFVPGCGTWPGALADLIAGALNVEASTWLLAAGPIEVELEVLDWFKEWLGYPPAASGILTSGGSAANMTALACARERIAGEMSDDLVVYAPDQTHASVARGARILGFRPHQLRVLPTDERFRIRLDALAGAIERDERAGRRPLLVCASAGSTSTGSIDPLPDVAALCRERGVWLHVDGAYGAFAVLTDRGARLLEGIGLADSVTLDPHKWLFQPFECGCVLVRDGLALPEAFAISPDYLKDSEERREVNLYDYGMQLSRSWRALKVWLSVRSFGLDAFRTAIDRGLELALHAERRIVSSPAFELLSPASLGIVCFRRRFPDVTDELALAGLNASLGEAINASGTAFLTSTRLRGRHALRLCILNHTTTRADVDAALDFLEQAKPDPAAQVSLSPAGRERLVTGGRQRPGTVDRDGLREVPLLAELDEAGLDWVLEVARELEVMPGETIVEQWDSSRDFYVVLDGVVEIVEGGERVAERGSGEFFGELASLDWGSSFGYARTATVSARTSTRLLVLPFPSLNELVRRYPDVDEEIRRAASQRLQSSAG
jgi:glutamate/tyrosine decarboxylase-like PLP-dependent enzyme